MSVKIDESGKFGFVAFEKNEDAQAALAQLGDTDFKVARCQKRQEREQLLRREYARMMRDISRNNLHFKGFPADDDAQKLQDELKTFFEKFGEVKTLKLPTKTRVVEGVETEQLLGFGFVAFQTLDAAQKCKYDCQKELFKGTYKLVAS